MSLRFAAVRITARGVPRPSQITWCLEPGRRRSTGEGPVFSPPFGPHMRAIHHSAGPVQLPLVLQLVQQHLVQALPDPRFVPVPQPPPARHARPAPHLLRQILPRDTRFQHEQDARQRLPIGYPLAPRIPVPTLHARQQRLDPSPQPITDQWFRHGHRLRRQHPKPSFC